MTTILLIIGLILVAMLLFLGEMLTPSFGVMSALGVGALVGAVILGFTVNTVLGIVLIVASMVGAPAYFIVMVHYLPRTRAGRALFLFRKGDDTGAGTPEADEHEELIGKTGTAETMLRPSGAVRIDGKRLIALSESGIIRKGTNVKVLRLSGSSLIVRAEKSAAKTND